MKLNEQYIIKLIQLASELQQLQKPAVFQSSPQDQEMFIAMREVLFQSKLNYLLGFILALDAVRMGSDKDKEEVKEKTEDSVDFKSYHCDFCDREFRSWLSKTRHESSQHPNDVEKRNEQFA